jgi:hypothetical protein
MAGEATGALLDRTLSAGQTCCDISQEDLLRTLAGLCLLNDKPG